MARRYDSISKYLIRGYPEPIAGLVLGDPDVEVEGSYFLRFCLLSSPAEKGVALGWRGDTSSVGFRASVV